jgi:hypothetical protein
MPSRRPFAAVFAATLACTLFCAAAPAQNSASKSGFNMSAHANSNISASDIGLPAYPGAVPAKDSKDDDSSADIGFSLGDFHFKMIVASYRTSDSPAQVLAFYRKPLAKYGDVIECNHGKPVGSPAVARSGLSCSTQHDGDSNGDVSKDGPELRAGSPRYFRIVGIDSDSHPGSTKFGLVYLELPKDSDSGSK